MRCQHGINLKHSRCDTCVEIADAEEKEATRPQSKKLESITLEKPNWQVTDHGDVALFESPAKIDLHHLEIEWQEQDQRYKRAAELLAKAKKRLAEEEAEMEVVEAELKKEIRRYPDNYGITKTTNDPVNDAMTLDPKHCKQKQAVIDRQYEVDMLSGYVRQMDHRKTALEKEVDLWLGAYFSKPREPEKRMKVKKKVNPTIMYGIGIDLKGEGDYRMTNGPHPSLDTMLKADGEIGAYILELDGEGEKPLYYWYNSSCRWKKITNKQQRD